MQYFVLTIDHVPLVRFSIPFYRVILLRKVEDYKVIGPIFSSRVSYSDLLS
jgi:hypothetical protein